jgi:serine/threonine protein kinase
MWWHWRRQVGTGGSGVVFRATWRGTACAAKRLNLILNLDSVDEFKAEVLMLTKLRHPNVVLFFGVSFRDHDCYVVTEYCERGSLLSVLQVLLRAARME